MKGITVRPIAVGLLISPGSLGASVQPESLGVSISSGNYGIMADGKKGNEGGYVSYWAWGNGEWILWGNDEEVIL